MAKIDFSYASKKEHNFAQRLIIKTIERFSGKKKLESIYSDYSKENVEPRYFWRDLLKVMKINVVDKSQHKFFVPNKGSLIIIANHPFGIIDGLILCALVSEVRGDFKIMTHETLRFLPQLDSFILPVDFSKSSKEVIKKNIDTANKAKKFVNQGGAIIIFPSGSVSVAKNLNSEAKDDDWKIFPAKLIQQTKSDVLPIYFEGKNGFLFHLFASKLKNQTLKYSSYIHETRRKIGKNIHINIGNIIKYSEISNITDRKQLTEYLKEHTYSLKNNNEIN